MPGPGTSNSTSVRGASTPGGHASPPESSPTLSVTTGPGTPSPNVPVGDLFFICYHYVTALLQWDIRAHPAV